MLSLVFLNVITVGMRNCNLGNGIKYILYEELNMKKHFHPLIFVMLILLSVSFFCTPAYADSAPIVKSFSKDANGILPLVTIENGQFVADVKPFKFSTSSSTVFLNKVNPETAIISVGADNNYGHPAQETLQRIENSGAEIFRTDFSGDIVITTDGINYEVSESNVNEELLTRADLSEILVYKLDLSLSIPAEPFFPDVPLDHWAAGYIYTAVNEGLLNGYPDGKFHPEYFITRAEYAAVLCMVFKIPSYTPSTPSFSDVPANHWAYTFIESIKHAGIMNGTLEGTFLPEEGIKKDDAIRVMERIPITKFGDMNEDGIINILDLQFINSNLGLVTTEDARKSDVNNDNMVNIVDLLMLAEDIGNYTFNR